MMRSFIAVSAGWLVALLIAAPPAESSVHTPDLHQQVMTVLAQVSAPDRETYDFEVITIPALEGIAVTLDGVTRTTNSLGSTVFSVKRVSGELDRNVGKRIVVETVEVEIDSRTIARFARPVARTQSVALMFSTYFKTAFDFEDANGNVVPNFKIQTVMIKSSTGEALEVDINDEIWLLGSRVAGSARPEIKPVFWTINDVIVSGASVAHRGQTKFFPERDEQISSRLLLFDVRFRPVDAFFGFSVGDEITVTTPRGKRFTLELDDGVATVGQLPRGQYEVVVEGSGLRISRPVTLTRNQDLRLLYYSRFDIVIVVVALAAFLTLPFVIGRRRREARENQSTPLSAEPQRLGKRSDVEMMSQPSERRRPSRLGGSSV